MYRIKGDNIELAISVSLFDKGANKMISNEFMVIEKKEFNEGDLADVITKLIRRFEKEYKIEKYED